MDQLPPPKRIVVIGGGLAGVSTAEFLSRAGHQVTVVERGPDVARGTSYANAGRFTPSGLAAGPITTPAALTGMIKSIVTSLFSSTDPKQATGERLSAQAASCPRLRGGSPRTVPPCFCSLMMYLSPLLYVCVDTPARLYEECFIGYLHLQCFCKKKNTKKT